MLEIKNLSKNFEKIQALENINLHVKEGEFLSILEVVEVEKARF